MSAQDQHQGEDEDMFVGADESEEIVNRDEDHPMESDGEEDQQMSCEQEITLQNDSSAHFGSHNDSIFCIAQHSVHNNIIITGAGDDLAYVFDSTPAEKPVLPRSYAELRVEPPASRARGLAGSG